MPPGPRLPRFVQTLGFVFFPVPFVEACRRRYGNVVTMGTPPGSVHDAVTA